MAQEVVETLDTLMEESARMGIPVRNPTERFFTFSVVGGLAMWYFKPDFAFYTKVEGTQTKRVPRPWTVTDKNGDPNATIFPWYFAAMVPGIAMSYFI